MGSCFSLEGGRSESIVPAQRSQIPEDEQVEPTVTSELAIPVPEVAESVVMLEALRTGFITDQRPERHIRVRSFTYDEVCAATHGFEVDRFLGQGGFGQVYRGFLESTNQEVAIKRLDLQGQQGHREFVTEVLILSNVHHPNLVKLVGHCTSHDQRILVYEYMPLGSLNSHIHDLPPGQQPLDWSTRIKILLGAAKGLEHLHHNLNPPVINRDVKCANILLGAGYHPKLSDFGLAKLGPTGDNTHVSTRVMGTPGYCAPEYLMTGKLTVKTDIYSFGVVMLEVLTGRMARDERLPESERNLVAWALNFLRRRELDNLLDPALRGQCPQACLEHAFFVVSRCISESPNTRPSMRDVVASLTVISEFRNRNTRRLERGGRSTPTRTPDRNHRGDDQGEGS
ncbi:probable serine/threonine-protein kinase PBL7 [Zea mays]|uniref:Putative serine/threonine-protein kinase RLCKVII n=1 Tax=Zea mays TaxID=4577 RepID=A0A1D6JYV4_MAIZE|nr:probable serine/threonine-protein kinase PBL7 [Zea mays]ONL96804.1 putative serine/threonine-protein kinase RLCKVII [Zea mays]|eukprot:XP_008654424.1 probable serine/threonine-protein kinase PBL7 [Zea mays]